MAKNGEAVRTLNPDMKDVQTYLFVCVACNLIDFYITC